MDTLLSVEFLKFFLPLAFAIVAWLFNERWKRQADEYLRKEDRYRNLLLSLRGFYEGQAEHALKQAFVDQLLLCWLYCSDDVVRKGNALLDSLQLSGEETVPKKEAALRDFALAIRKDLLSRKIVRKTTLKGEDLPLVLPVSD